MTIKSTIFAVSAALSLAVPAVAAPVGGGMMMMGGHHDALHDHSHRPPLQVEHRPSMPHGRYRWHAGAWAWTGDHWGWTPGIWVKF